jgi:hypothetical protein
MPISVPFTGGCACGAIRYQCTAPPLLVWKCHCRTCQQATGSAFNLNVMVPATALTYTTGEPKYYGSKGGSGNTLYRGFCPACGSPLGGKSDAFPDLRGISGASIDDPSGLEPVADIWTASAHPWDYLHPQLPKYERQPTAEEFNALLTTFGNRTTAGAGMPPVRRTGGSQ